MTQLWGFWLGGGLSALMWLSGDLFIDFLTTAPDVRLLSRDYLLWAALTPLVATLAFQMDGIYVGATWSSTMRNVMLVATTIFIAERSE